MSPTRREMLASSGASLLGAAAAAVPGLQAGAAESQTQSQAAEPVAIPQMLTETLDRQHEAETVGKFYPFDPAVKSANQLSYSWQNLRQQLARRAAVMPLVTATDWCRGAVCLLPEGGINQTMFDSVKGLQGEVSRFHLNILPADLDWLLPRLALNSSECFATQPPLARTFSRFFELVLQPLLAQLPGLQLMPCHFIREHRPAEETHEYGNRWDYSFRRFSSALFFDLDTMDSSKMTLVMMYLADSLLQGILSGIHGRDYLSVDPVFVPHDEEVCLRISAPEICVERKLWHCELRMACVVQAIPLKSTPEHVLTEGCFRLPPRAERSGFLAETVCHALQQLLYPSQETKTA